MIFKVWISVSVLEYYLVQFAVSILVLKYLNKYLKEWTYTGCGKVCDSERWDQYAISGEVELDKRC